VRKCWWVIELSLLHNLHIDCVEYRCDDNKEETTERTKETGNGMCVCRYCMEWQEQRAKLSHSGGIRRGKWGKYGTDTVEKNPDNHASQANFFLQCTRRELIRREIQSSGLVYQPVYIVQCVSVFRKLRKRCWLPCVCLVDSKLSVVGLTWRW